MTLRMRFRRPSWGFFRQFKLRNVLKPQFKPLFRRMEFLSNIGDDEGLDVIKEKGDELVAFVSSFNMGEFYSAAIKKILQPPSIGAVLVIGHPESQRRYDEARAARRSRYIQQVRQGVAEIHG